MGDSKIDTEYIEDALNDIFLLRVVYSGELDAMNTSKMVDTYRNILTAVYLRGYGNGMREVINSVKESGVI